MFNISGKIIIRICLFFPPLLLLLSCGSDSQSIVKNDREAKKDYTGTILNDMSIIGSYDFKLAKENSLIEYDAANIITDAGVIADSQIQFCSKPFEGTATNNIVDNCKKCGENDTCLSRSDGKNYCVGNCCIDRQSKDAKYDACKVTNNKQKAECIPVELQDGYPGTDLCWWLCETKDGQGNILKFSPPDLKSDTETAWKCITLFQDSNDKYWTPK